LSCKKLKKLPVIYSSILGITLKDYNEFLNEISKIFHWKMNWDSLSHNPCFKWISAILLTYLLCKYIINNYNSCLRYSKLNLKESSKNNKVQWILIKLGDICFFVWCAIMPSYGVVSFYRLVFNTEIYELSDIIKEFDITKALLFILVIKILNNILDLIIKLLEDKKLKWWDYSSCLINLLLLVGVLTPSIWFKLNIGIVFIWMNIETFLIIIKPIIRANIVSSRLVKICMIPISHLLIPDENTNRPINSQNNPRVPNQPPQNNPRVPNQSPQNNPRVPNHPTQNDPSPRRLRTLRPRPYPLNNPRVLNIPSQSILLNEPSYNNQRISNHPPQSNPRVPNYLPQNNSIVPNYPPQNNPIVPNYPLYNNGRVPNYSQLEFSNYSQIENSNRRVRAQNTYPPFESSSSSLPESSMDQSNSIISEEIRRDREEFFSIRNSYMSGRTINPNFSIETPNLDISKMHVTTNPNCKAYYLNIEYNVRRKYITFIHDSLHESGLSKNEVIDILVTYYKQDAARRFNNIIDVIWNTIDPFKEIKNDIYFYTHDFLNNGKEFFRFLPHNVPLPNEDGEWVLKPLTQISAIILVGTNGEVELLTFRGYPGDSEQIRQNNEIMFNLFNEWTNEIFQNRLGYGSDVLNYYGPLMNKFSNNFLKWMNDNNYANSAERLRLANWLYNELKRLREEITWLFRIKEWKGPVVGTLNYSPYSNALNSYNEREINIGEEIGRERTRLTRNILPNNNNSEVLQELNQSRMLPNRTNSPILNQLNQSGSNPRITTSNNNNSNNNSNNDPRRNMRIRDIINR